MLVLHRGAVSMSQLSSPATSSVMAAPGSSPRPAPTTNAGGAVVSTGDVGRRHAPGPGQELQRVTRRLRRPEKEVPVCAAVSPGAAGAGHRSWRWRLLCAVRAVVSCVGRARGKVVASEAEVAAVRWLLLGSGRFYRGRGRVL